MNPALTLQTIRDALERVRQVAPATPLIDVSHALDRPDEATSQGKLLLKCETMQPIGAFKIRGAYNMIAKLSPAERARGLLACSSGNHGQAVAMAAQKFGVRAVIVMPTTAARTKVEGVKRFGANIIFEGTTSEQRGAWGAALAKERGLTLIPPYDHEDVIAGQATIGIELLDQCPNLDTVYVPVGGGGLISGLASAIRLLRPNVRIIGVEPVGAAKMKAAVAAGKPVRLDRVQSIADGLLAEAAGNVTFGYVKQFVDDLITVDEREIASAVLWLFHRARLVVEPSGAVSVAAALRALQAAPEGADDVIAHPGRAGDQISVAILSGGNIDLDTLMRLPAIAGEASVPAPARLHLSVAPVEGLL